MIARVLAEKDTLRCQLMEVQERVFSLQTKHSPIEQLPTCDVNSDTNTNCNEHTTHTELIMLMQCNVFVSKDMDWGSPSSSCEDSECPSRPRLRRMDALNPMSPISCHPEVSHNHFTCLGVLSNTFLTLTKYSKLKPPLNWSHQQYYLCIRSLMCLIPLCHGSLKNHINERYLFTGSHVSSLWWRGALWFTLSQTHIYKSYWKYPQTLKIDATKCTIYCSLLQWPTVLENESGSERCYWQHSNAKCGYPPRPFHCIHVRTLLLFKPSAQPNIANISYLNFMLT